MFFQFYELLCDFKNSYLKLKIKISILTLLCEFKNSYFNMKINNSILEKILFES
jgi:hypothetical protein